MASDATVKESLNPDLALAEEQIERTREQVTMSVLALRDEVVRRADWREWVRRRPGTFVGAALVLGFLWGHRRR